MLWTWTHPGPEVGYCCDNGSDYSPTWLSYVVYPSGSFLWYRGKFHALYQTNCLSDEEIELWLKKERGF